jgi:hypothetical protein
MGRARRWLVIVLAASTLGAAAFPTKTVPPSEYAESICTSSRDWARQITELEAVYDQAIAGAPDLSTEKALEVDFVEDAIETTRSLVRRTGKAGTPDARRGKLVARIFTSGYRDVRQNLDDVLEAARDLPARDQAGFDAALNELDAALDDATDEFGETIEDASNEFSRELRAAFMATPACLELHAVIPTTSTTTTVG